MLSCCEEAEEKEWAVRDALKAGAKHNENRLMGKARLKEQMAASLRCVDPCCVCSNCDDDAASDKNSQDGKGLQADATNPTQSGTSSSEDDASDDEWDDSDNEAILEKMRTTRLKQMQAQASKLAARTADGFGSYSSIGEEKLFLLLRETSSTLVLCHLSCEDHTISGWVDNLLSQAAIASPKVRFVKTTPAAGVPPQIPGVLALPALVLFDQGLIVASNEALFHEREPANVRAHLEQWMAAELQRSRGRARGSDGSDDDDDDDEGTAQSFCGRPGCRTYAHEHVAWGQKQGA